MDPNDIYSLAQQAGMVDPDPIATPSYADTLNSTTPPGGFTDEDLLAHFVPQDKSALFQDEDQPILKQPEDPFAPPAPSAPPIPGSPSSVTTGVKGSASVSNSGFSSAKNQQVRKGPGAAIRSDINTIQQQGEQQLADRTAGFNAAAGDEKEAAHAEALATAAGITAEGHQKQILANLQQNYDARTNELIVGEQGKANEAKANYVSALNDFRAARVNPAQLWGEMSGFEQGGMAVAAFVHDFLGAKGIQTSAMSTFNKAIDRNMDAQIRAIQTKGEVAQGFKTLWDMQMQESSSMQEARTRMRGFMLDSAKTATESYLAQFNAALATAKGRAAVAKLDTELQKNILEVSKHVDASTSARITQAISLYGHELSASMESARIAVAREANQIERDKMNATKGVINPYEGLIFDTTESGGGAARWEFNDPKSPLNKDYLQAQSDTDHLLKLSREYQSLNRQFKNQGAASGTRWSSVESARLRAVATEIHELRALALTGKGMTDSERATIAQATPQALFGGTLDVAPVIAQTENHMRGKLDSFRRQVAHPLQEGDSRTKIISPDDHFGEMEQKEAAAIVTGGDKTKDAEQIERDYNNRLLEKHSAYDRITDVGSDVRKDHDSFMAAHPEVNHSRGLSDDKDTVFNYERGLSRVKSQAERAKEFANEASDEKEKAHHLAVYNENVDLLKLQAAPVITGAKPDDTQGLYAIHMLHKLGVEVQTAPTQDAGDSLPVEGGLSAHEDIDPRALPPLPKKK